MIINPYRFGAGAPPSSWTTTAINLPFNGANNSTTFTDSSGRTWTANGNAKLSTAQFVEGTASLLLDGSGDYASTPSTSDIQMSGDLRMTCSIRPTITGLLKCIASKRPIGSSEFLWYIDTDNKIKFAAYGAGPVNVIPLASTTTISANTWYDIAVQRVGTSWALEVNGVTEATGTESASVVTNTEPFLIGRDVNTSTRDFSGYIDRFKFLRP